MCKLLGMKYYRLSGFSLFEVLLAWFVFMISMAILANVQLQCLRRMQTAIAHTQVIFAESKHGIEQV